MSDSRLNEVRVGIWSAQRSNGRCDGQFMERAGCVFIWSFTIEQLQLVLSDQPHDSRDALTPATPRTLMRAGMDYDMPRCMPVNAAATPSGLDRRIPHSSSSHPPCAPFPIPLIHFPHTRSHACHQQCLPFGCVSTDAYSGILRTAKLRCTVSTVQPTPSSLRSQISLPTFQTTSSTATMSPSSTDPFR